MNSIDLITYRSRPSAHGITIVTSATSLRDYRQTDRWQRRLDPWLRAGSPQGSAFLDFGSEAAFIQFQATTGTSQSWQSARVMVGPSAELTGSYALEMPADGTGSRRDARQSRVRRPDAVAALIPVLAHSLQGARRVTMPSADPALAEAVLWGLITIEAMTGDTRPISFVINASGISRDTDIPGMLVSFRADVGAPLPPDQGFAALATDLAHRFADDPAELRQALTEHGLATAADASGRISRLLSLPPRIQPGNDDRGRTATVTTSFGEPAAPANLAAGTALTVMCPICLGDIPNWGKLDYWRWDPAIGDGEYVKIDIPLDLNPTQRARFTHGAYVRCPAAADETMIAHYLPARYGRFGDPILLGFVGLTQSGKTHLLASMIAEIGRLSDYGVDVTELDRATHHDFLEKSVKPLITGHKVLPGTPDDATTALADAFIIRQGRTERVVALFDVSGGNLARGDKATEFLWIADGLFFIVDPDHIGASKVGDDTFSSVLDIMGERPKPEPACAAIVLNKADKARFEEPIARWLRAGNGTLEATEFLRESADVYAYLERHKAIALAKPYQACRKATLHVASPTGGAQDEDRASTYPRGVTPLRVLRPLVAMLAMTGVLTGPQAELIGV